MLIFLTARRQIKKGQTRSRETKVNRITKKDTGGDNHCCRPSKAHTSKIIASM